MPKESDSDDYGFYHPFDTIEKLYWERENSDRVIYPDTGGALDQNALLMEDLAVYGWLVAGAERAIDKHSELEDLAKKQLQAKAAKAKDLKS